MSDHYEFILNHGYDTSWIALPNNGGEIMELREITDELNRLKRERDEALAYADKLAAGLPEGMLPKDVEVLRDANLALAVERDSLQEQLDAAIIQELKECRDEREIEEIIAAAKAVIDRWETPFWKEAAHTGLYIATLRKAVEITEGRCASESRSAKINVANHQQPTNEPERRHDGRRKE